MPRAYGVTPDGKVFPLKNVHMPPDGTGENGGYYTPEVSQTGTDQMTVSFTPSKPGMPPVEPVTVTLPKGAGGGGGRAVIANEAVSEDTQECILSFPEQKSIIVSMLFTGTSQNESEANVTVEPMYNSTPSTGLSINYAARIRGTYQAMMEIISPADEFEGPIIVSGNGCSRGSRICKINGLKLRTDSTHYIAAGTKITVETV